MMPSLDITGAGLEGLPQTAASLLTVTLAHPTTKFSQLSMTFSTSKVDLEQVSSNSRRPAAPPPVQQQAGEQGRCTL